MKVLTPLHKIILESISKSTYIKSVHDLSLDTKVPIDQLRPYFNELITCEFLIISQGFIKVNNDKKEVISGLLKEKKSIFFDLKLLLSNIQKTFGRASHNSLKVKKVYLSEEEEKTVEGLLFQLELK